MFQSIDDVQKLGRENIDVAVKSLTAMSKGMQAMTADAVDYSRKSFEASSATLERLLGAKSLEKAVEIQADFVRGAYEGFVAQATRMGDLVTDMTKESYKPLEGILGRVTSK
jgi:hypothetical protein